MTAFPTFFAPPWRAMAGLAILVLLGHLALLGVLPMGNDPSALPLADKFIVRTIEMAPPPATPAVAPQPSPKPAPSPPKRLARVPKSPSKAPAPEMLTTAPSAVEQPSVLPAASDSSADADGMAGTSAEGASAGQGEGAGPSGTGTTDGMPATPGATQPLRIHGSAHLSFEMTGQRGPQPYTGAFGELIWLQDGNEYNARLSLQVVWKTFLHWTSIGRLDAGGIAPERFSETKRNEVASHLVRDQGQVVFSNNAPSVPLQPGAQDRLSVIMQLGAMLAGDPARYPSGSRISIQTVGTREAGVWVFEIGEEERITVPAGEFTVRRILRQPRFDYDYQLELWLAPELGYLPAQLRQTQVNGDSFELRLRKVLDPE